MFWTIEALKDAPHAYKSVQEAVDALWRAKSELERNETALSQERAARERAERERDGWCRLAGVHSRACRRAVVVISVVGVIVLLGAVVIELEREKQSHK